MNSFVIVFFFYLPDNRNTTFAVILSNVVNRAIKLINHLDFIYINRIITLTYSL
jgi:hypothetical protein